MRFRLIKLLRKSSLITLVFLLIWSWIAFSYPIELAPSCCSQNECQYRYSEKGDTEQLSLRTKNYSEGSHCNCIPCEKPNTKEAFVLGVYFAGLDKEQALALEQNILEKTVLDKENIVVHPDNKTPLKFLPFFLLNSSFLL